MRFITKKLYFVFCFLLAMRLAVAGPPNKEQWMLGNPASTSCSANHGGSIYMATDSKTGGQYGICQLPPTLAVEEWCLYRNDPNIEKKDCANLIILLKEGVK